MSTDKIPGYLANPSGECCLKGTIHEGEARGSWEVIADVETYVSKPPTDKANGHVVLYFPDVWEPLFMSCSEVDHTFDVSSRRRALDILQSKKKIYHYQLFSGVEHGFALRGDPKDPYQRWVKEQSLAGIVASMVPPRAFDFAGDVAIVTGAGSRMDGEIGNGRAAAILLARHGAKVALLDLNEDWARETKRMIDEEGGTSEVIQTDVSKEDSCRDAVSKTVELFGAVHILVNNVGVGGAIGNATNINLEAWERDFRINVTSMVMMSRYAIPEMRKQGRGSIINISSTTAGRSDRPALKADGLAAENTGIEN
ncbi:hypothetical protein K4K54_003601 [Colletotrichum sp. SAR 10_86]|nr:hypothetical protein K4K54_003601 [Colletotrichum sp. SAR 10_86]